MYMNTPMHTCTNVATHITTAQVLHSLLCTLATQIGVANWVSCHTVPIPCLRMSSFRLLVNDLSCERNVVCVCVCVVFLNLEYVILLHLEEMKQEGAKTRTHVC